MFTRTPEQVRAIETHDRNLMVVAGAGSGKTSVLVSRFLALLDAHPDWPLNALVAITFTQKAAQEMRDRVRQGLEERLARAESPESALTWSSRIASMDSARIDTIHALCAAILRANAAEAGIDPGFSVLDETDAAILLENVIDDVLRLLVAGGDPALALFTEYDSASIRRALVSLAATELSDLPDDVLADWQRRWEAEATEAVEALLQHDAFVAAVQWNPGLGWPEGDDKLLAVWSNCHDWFEVLEIEDLPTRLDALRKLKSNIVLTVGGAAAWGGKEGLAESKAVLKRLRQVIAEALDEIGEPLNELDARAARALPLWRSLISRVQTAYREAKQALGMLDFDDLETRTQDVLTRYPTVRARYQNAEFKHILVDEFQDTNAAQWAIVQALADPARPGSLFVVGDPKQSIYAFRGADVSVFGRVRQQLRAAGGDEVLLGRSFRTHKPLVDCFNEVFERVLIPGSHRLVSAYHVERGEAMDAHRAEPPCDEPFVELALLDRGSDRTERRSAESLRRQEARELASALRQMVESGRAVYDRHSNATRPMHYGDVALLFQSMTAITVYEAVFKAEGLPFVTVAGRGYYDRQEVWDLINLLRVLYNPADNLALASVLRSPLFNLSDDALYALRLMVDDRGATLPLWNAVEIAALDAPSGIDEDEAGLVASAWTALADLRRLAGRVPIADLLREALTQTGYLATLTGLPDGARKRGNVEKLVEKAAQSGKVTLGAFSQYLNELSEREAREGEALLDVSGAITLMSVHKSKGLEFPVVALVDMSWRLPAVDRNLVVHDPHYGLICRALDPVTNKLERPHFFKRVEALRQMREEAERRRLLYVAATRAQDYLLLSGQVRQGTDGWKGDGWLGWTLDALDLTTIEPQPVVEHERVWGRVRVRFPALVDDGRADRTPEADSESEQESGREPEREALWDAPLVQERRPLPGVEAAPPTLVGEAPNLRRAVARSLTATQLADLGSIDLPEEGALYKKRLRRSVLHDAPAFIETVSLRRRRVPDPTLVEIVRKALRWWEPSQGEHELESRLRSYAWEAGIVDARQQDDAVSEAGHLLKATVNSAMFGWLADARQVYRDVPVVYQAGGRTLHGVIDILLQRPDGSWTLIDYKTAPVRHDPPATPRQTLADVLAEHARRYHLQVGVYAAAVRDQLQSLALETDSDAAGESTNAPDGDTIVPDVFIHYIRHAHTVPVSRDDWEAALVALDQRVGDVLGQGP